MKWIQMFDWINGALFILLTILYFYQSIYIIIGLLNKKKDKSITADKNLRYAIMISARNEGNVIGELLVSLLQQNYPKENYDIFILADNSEDNTYQTAIEKGVHAYRRFNLDKVGKGYALNDLYWSIQRDYGDIYDGYLVFDADNIVDPDFLKEMNNTFHTGKYDALTSYRNSKNFCANWLTYGYSVWFLHEARLVNAARFDLGTTCMISGTGFLVSGKLMKENGGWPYHLLTEDIEFSVNCALKGKKIGYCNKAVLYDEQPEEFSQSWKQRLRWSKGFFQINAKYGKDLATGVLKKGNNRFGIYDVIMTVAPCTLLTIALIIISGFAAFASCTMPLHTAHLIQDRMREFIMVNIGVYYLLFFMMALITVLSEWNNIKATSFEKVKYLPLFPLFLFSYVPITIVALFKPVQWTPISHHTTTELSKTTKRAI